MTTKKKSQKLVPFDAARYLNDDAAIAEYESVVQEAGDPDLLLLARSDIARAKAANAALHEQRDERAPRG